MKFALNLGIFLISSSSYLVNFNQGSFINCEIVGRYLGILTNILFNSYFASFEIIPDMS